MTIRIAALAAGLGLALGGAGAAQAADQASLLLNWYLGGLHTPFYLGVERGYYAEEGIELTINEGRGSGRAVQVVAAKGDTFGMADAGSLMLGAAQGAPIKAVMSLLNTSGFGIISLKETGIASVKDLEGKTLAVSPGDALTQLFPAVVAANDLDADTIELVFMDPPAKPVAVMEKRTDALLGGIDDQYFLIEAQGASRPRRCASPTGRQHGRHHGPDPRGHARREPRPRAPLRQGERARLAGGARRSGRGGRGGAQGQARPQPRIDAQAAPGRPRPVVLGQHRGPGHRLRRRGRLAAHARSS